MSFFRYIFSFLYTRNWHTGKMELSPARVWVFVGFIALVLLGLVMIEILQTPLRYEAP